jgi:hypothetical protein
VRRLAAAAAVAAALGGGAAGCANTKSAKPGFGLAPGKAFDLERVSGRVVVAPTGRAKFTLGGRSRVPAGARVDARAGRVRITAARPGGGTESARVSGGVFTLRSESGGAQTRLERGEGGTADALKLSGPPTFAVR